MNYEIFIPEELWQNIINKVTNFKDLLSVRSVSKIFYKYGTLKILKYNVSNFSDLEKPYLHPISRCIYSPHKTHVNSLKISNTKKYNSMDNCTIKFEASEYQNTWTCYKDIEGQLLDINMRFKIPVKIWKTNEIDKRVYFLGWWYVKRKHISKSTHYTLEKYIIKQ